MITLATNHVNTQPIRDVEWACLEKLLDIVGIDSPRSVPSFLSSFISRSASLHERRRA